MDLTARQILAFTKPEGLYPADGIARKELYHQLVKQWHPDSIHGQTAVFQHITFLYKEAQRKLAEGL